MEVADNAKKIKQQAPTSALPVKKRDSNLELYRIIVMFLIVAHHYVVCSGLTAADGPIYLAYFSWRTLFLLLFGAWGKTGINCFVLITGYFMCQSQITVRKFAKLFFEVMFYRIIIYAIFLLTTYEPFSIKTLAITLIPVSKIADNFTSCFLMFYLCIPFLNMLVHRLTEKQHLYLLCLTGFLYVVLGTAHRIKFNYVTWFSILYFIASYIRLYPKLYFFQTRLWGYLTLLFVLLGSLSVVFCVWIVEKFNSNAHLHYAFVSDCNSFLPVAIGVCSFLFFKNVKVPYSRLINSVAASTFGVLLIHANSDTMRRWIWQDVLNNVGVYNSQFMLIWTVCGTGGVFLVCSLIDMLRIRYVERPFFMMWDANQQRIIDAYKKIERNILGKLNVCDLSKGD